MFETRKVRRNDKFRTEWSQHKIKCKSQMGQDQVSGGVSVLCWLTAPVVISSMGTSVIRSKSVLKSSSVISSQIGVMSDQLRVSLYIMVMTQNVMWHLGLGRLHNIWWDPHIDHKTSWGTISNVPWHIPVWGT